MLVSAVIYTMDEIIQTDYTNKIIAEKKSTQSDFDTYTDDHYEFWQEQSERCLFDRDNGFLFGTTAKIYCPTKTTFSQELFRFAAIMAEDSNCGLTVFSFKNQVVLLQGIDKYSTCPNELSIRFTKDIIVVKNVEFVHKRRGYMTKVYEYLIELAQKYQIPQIEIESVVSDEMENWCRKYGFEKKYDCYYIDVQPDPTREERLKEEGILIHEAYLKDFKNL